MSNGPASSEERTEDLTALAAPAYPRWQLAAKRSLDVLISAFLLILISPLWLLIVFWIRLDSTGPALFKQIRVGRGGRPYTIYKFRTMVQDAEALDRERLAKVQNLDEFVYQQKEDPRITRSGRFLRKTSLDELPQLLNILKGEMSLVGPRPEVPDIARHFTPEQRRLRFAVLPGVTGLAQVNGRSELTVGEILAYDIRYVRDWSFWLDLRILARTVVVVLSGKDAY